MLHAAGCVLSIAAVGLAGVTWARNGAETPPSGPESVERVESVETVEGPDVGRGAAAAGTANETEETDGWQGFWVGPLRIGGALRFNYSTRSWDDDYDWPGELALDTARLNLVLNAEHLFGSFEFRYYYDRFSGGHDYAMLHDAWLGWRFDARHALEAGVTKVPFGILPYASHNWFFQLPYYVGFEDDYDLGLKYVGTHGAWNLQAAWFFRDESAWYGDSDDSARYSYDLVREGTAGNAERGQLNLRVAHEFRHAERFTTEVGLSLMGGRVKNSNPLGGAGDRYAFAVHANAFYGRWNFMLQTLRYEFDVENDPNLDPSPDGLFVSKGAYDSSYNVASAAWIGTLGVAYRLPIDWKFVEAVTFYNDFSLMTKDASGYRDTLQNVTGCSILAGPLFVYVDVAVGRNQPWLGGDWTNGLASGGVGTGTNTRFNVNIGLYF